MAKKTAKKKRDPDPDNSKNEVTLGELRTVRTDIIELQKDVRELQARVRHLLELSGGTW